MHASMYSIEQVDQTARRLQPEITCRLEFSRAPQHIVGVSIRLMLPAGTTPIVFPAWVPGSYKIRDFVSNQGNLAIASVGGQNLPFRWITANRLEVDLPEESQVEISYTYYANEISVRHSHVSRFHAFINPGNLLMYVPGRTGEPIGLELHHSWRTVSTTLAHDADRQLWLAENFDVLVDSPIEIGDHDSATFTVEGAEHAVVITGEGNFDRDWVVDQCRRVVEAGIAFWGNVPYDRYIFFLQFLPGQYGGLEHARSQVSVFDAGAMRDPTKVRRFLSLLTHEYFHTWNVKRLRPVELGPFDYETENYSAMLWLAEGATSYYDDLLSYRTGFYSRKEYLRVLSEQHLTALFDVPGRGVMSIRESSYLAWVKLYNQTPDSHNRFPSYYLKGGVLFLLLDLLIVRESNGERTLADGMRALFERYRENPAVGVSEQEFLDIVTEATGVDIAETFVSWLDGTDDPPFEELFSAVGLLWRPRAKKEERIGPAVALPEQPERWFGFATKEEKGSVVVARVADDSPAAAAGLGVDTEIIAVRGVRVTSNDRFRALTDGVRAGEPVELLCSADGHVFSATVEPVERPAMRLLVDDDASEEAIRLRDVWLGSASGETAGE